MTSGVRIERQGDGKYEVLFDDGKRVADCTLEAAVDLAEERLYPDTEQQEAMQGNCVGTPICSDLDSRSKVGSQSD